ncbi:hypothetical protein [Streptomyces nigra]|nr:hypothetical protein [Streptomyces nigra]
MTESPPSRAEGDRDQDDTPAQTEEAARTTPSRAEGDRADDDGDPS